MASKRVKKRRLIVFIVILVLALAACFSYWLYSERQKKLKESYSNLYSISRLELCESVTLESGTELTFNDLSISSLREVPDQIKSCILKYPDKAVITATGFDNVLVGTKEIILSTVVSDEYGQTIVGYQPLNIIIEDTFEPVIELGEEYLVVNNDMFFSIDKNVIRVYDEVYGNYRWSDNGENHT